MLAPVLAFAAAAFITPVAIIALMPLLRRYALARPNARSSHAVPTPQGGGIAVIAGALLGLAVAAGAVPTEGLLALTAATVLLALVGLIDDLRPLSPWPRLAFQSVAVIIAVTAGASAGRILPDAVPLGFERLLLVIAGLWFVNLVNFMDGLDWLTVVGLAPTAVAIALFGAAGRVPTEAMLVAAALAGALIGFAPFNRPVAKLFLGDVGSLPIGLLAGWALYELAAQGGIAAAILLPLYYLADATLTLLRRLVLRERIFEAHRSHFYQRATANGFSVPEVVGHVFVCNLVLVALAAITVFAPGAWSDFLCLAAGIALVGALLRRFSLPRQMAAA